MKRKKIISGLLAGAVVFSLIVPALAGQSGETCVSLTVAEEIGDYILIVPTATTVRNSGWNTLTNGLTVKSPKQNFDPEKQVQVDASSKNSFSLVNGSSSVSYLLQNGNKENRTVFFFPGTEINASEDGKTEAVGVDVSDYSNQTVGDYCDVITWTADVVPIQKEEEPSSETRTIDIPYAASHISSLQPDYCVTFNYTAAFDHYGKYQSISFTNSNPTNTTYFDDITWNDVVAKYSDRFRVLSIPTLGGQEVRVIADPFSETLKYTCRRYKTETYLSFIDIDYVCEGGGVISVSPMVYDNTSGRYVTYMDTLDFSHDYTLEPFAVEGYEQWGDWEIDF